MMDLVRDDYNLGKSNLSNNWFLIVKKGYFIYIYKYILFYI
jgi:hypothetical protein